MSAVSQPLVEAGFHGPAWSGIPKDRDSLKDTISVRMFEAASHRKPSLKWLNTRMCICLTYQKSSDLVGLGIAVLSVLGRMVSQ